MTSNSNILMGMWKHLMTNHLRDYPMHLQIQVFIMEQIKWQGM